MRFGNSRVVIIKIRATYQLNFEIVAQAGYTSGTQLLSLLVSLCLQHLVAKSLSNLAFGVYTCPIAPLNSWDGEVLGPFIEDRQIDKIQKIDPVSEL